MARRGRSAEPAASWLASCAGPSVGARNSVSPSWPGHSQAGGPAARAGAPGQADGLPRRAKPCLLTYHRSGHTDWVISWLQLFSMACMPSAGLTAPVRICSQAVLISFSTALPFGTPTIMVEYDNSSVKFSHPDG